MTRSKNQLALSILTIIIIATLIPIASAAPTKVISVPWQGDINKHHATWSGQEIILKGVIHTDTTDPIWYKWNFGDGTAESVVNTLSGKTKYNVEIKHTYTGAEETPFIAELIVADNDALVNPIEDPYLVKIQAANLDSKINVAIDNGLWFLYKSGSDGSTYYKTFDSSPIMVWSYSHYYASPTASAVHAFEINGHKETGDPDEDPYAEYVERGLNWLFNGYYSTASYPMLNSRVIGNTPNGDNPDTNGNGFGIEVKDRYYRPVYEGGMIMDAIIASGTPDADSGRDFDGDGVSDTYREVLQDMCDMYAWGQDDSGSDAGGWRYNWNSDSDNSACQWAAIGMMPAQNPPWNCDVPQWVKDYNDNWLTYSHSSWTSDGVNYGGFGYTGPGWGDARTPSGMVQLDFCGATTSDDRWVTCERWFADNWKDVGRDWLDQNNVYAYYAFAKAMRLAQPDPVVTFSSNNFDWYRGDGITMGLAEKISDRLVASSYWDYYGPNLGTAWCIITLKPVLFKEAPIACFDADPNPSYPDMTISFDPYCSGHSEAGKDINNLILFEWDWDNDGVYDESTTTPDVVTHSFSCSSIPCEYPVTLRVTDDNVPAGTATYVMNIWITNPPHPPVAKANGPYMVSLCPDDTLTLDGSSSYDPNEGEHEVGCDTCPGDTLTAWNWDLDGAPFDYIDESGEVIAFDHAGYSAYFGAAGNYNIGLRVTDNTAASYPTSGELDLTDEDFTVVEVYNGCLCELSATVGCQYVTLSWNDIGADKYVIYMSTEGVNSGFEDIATTTETSKTMGSVVMGATNYYRVMAITDDDKCLSNAKEVYADSELCNPTADPGGPYTGYVGEVITLDGSGSSALAGTIVAWDWDLDNDGQYDDAFGEFVELIWNSPDVYTIGLQVTSSDSLVLTDKASTNVEIKSSTSDALGTPGSNPNVFYSDDPINMGTGNYIYQHQDLFISGRGLPLTITRFYNSKDSYNGPFGHGWTFNYNINLAVAGSGDVVVMSEDGHRDAYTLNPDGTYSPPLGVFDTLVKNSDDTYTFERKDQIKYNFTSQGELVNITDQNGNQISFTYTGDDLTKVTDASGRELIFSYDTSCRIISITGPLNRIWSYTYDGAGNLVKYSDPLSGQFSYTYDENHRMTSIIDSRGNQIMANIFDEEGRVISQSNALGGTYTYSYDVGNQETTETDPFGGTIIYAFDEHFWGLSQTDQLGNTISYTYDENGNRISVTNENGQTSQFAYDANGNIIQITNPLGDITTMSYDSKDNLISLIDALGNQMLLEYDSNNNLIGMTNALGDETVFTYDEYGQIISGIDANGNTASFIHDVNGNQIAVTDAMGNTASFNYDIVSRLISMTDANGNTNALTYDDLDRLISVTDPLGNTASNTYDAVGNRISFTDTVGNSMSYSYNPLNQMVEVTDAMGGTVQYSYDVVGNRIFMTDANGHITNFAYDPLNRPISIIDPLGHTTSNTYDAIGNRISLTDAAGSLTTYSYDLLNQLVEVTDAMGGTVQYSYDAVGNMISMTDANGYTTNYAYDPLSRPTSIIDPLSHTTSNTYDAVGNIVGLTDANGNSTSYDYDALNRLTEIAYDDGQTVSYGYDATGNRLMMIDSHGTTNYQYDNLNRLVNVINPDSQTVGYTYDAVSNRIQMTYPDGKTMAYGYDANNRLTGVTDWNSHIAGYSYDANSNLIGMTYPNGMSTEYLYDENNQLIELINEDSTQVVSSFEYTLDATGNRQSVAEWFSERFEDESGIPQVLTTSYEYDDLYRLTQVNYPFEEIVSYNYDPMGNRISMTTTVDEIDKTINYVYDASDRLLQSGGTTYDYDNNGNMVRKTENPGRITSYNYDGANRLIALSKIFDKSQKEIYNFEYDGDGNRLSKTTINGKRTKSNEYLLDVNINLPQVLTESNDKDTTFYAHGLDLISMTDPHRGEFYYHYDGLGSVRSMSDSKESIKTIYLYDAFGQTRKEMGHVDNDFRFTGEQMDDETGLIYLRARYYDPNVGRFISKDPFTGFVSDTQSLNRYSYVRNNPVRFVDPWGLLYLDISVGAGSPVYYVGGSYTISIGERGIYFYGSPAGGLSTPITSTIGASISKPQKSPTSFGENLDVTVGAIVGKKITFDRDDILESSEEWVITTPGVVLESPQYLGGINHPWEEGKLLLRVGKRKVTSLWEDTKRKATPPVEDFKTIGRAAWRWVIPEAHSSELVMGKQ